MFMASVYLFFEMTIIKLTRCFTLRVRMHHVALNISLSIWFQPNERSKKKTPHTNTEKNIKWNSGNERNEIAFFA